MNDLLWSWILGGVGIVGFILTGRKIWWSWYINVGCQALWFLYAFATTQYGFIATAIVYTVVFGKNALSWTREHRNKKSEESQNDLVKDQRNRQLYIHQSHILMAGYQSATECINCGGNSKTYNNLKNLLVPCSMELSVYDGNSKFNHSTGETNV